MVDQVPISSHKLAAALLVTGGLDWTTPLPIGEICAVFDLNHRGGSDAVMSVRSK